MSNSEKMAATVGTGQGRKPTTSSVAALAHCLPQEAIWYLIRKLRTFDVADIEIAAMNHAGQGRTGFNTSTVRSYLQRLTRGGYLQQETKLVRGTQKKTTWTLIRDQGVEAPRLDRDGNPSKQGRVRDQLWRTLKILHEFDYIELAAAASIDESPVSSNTSRTYIRHLYKAGFLFQTRNSKPGTPARYRKVPGRCEGPKAPMVLRTRQVFDPNRMQIANSDNRRSGI